MAPGSRMMRLMDRPLSIGSEAASSWVTEPSSLSKAGRMAEKDATWGDFAVMICLPPDQMALGRNSLRYLWSVTLPTSRTIRRSWDLFPLTRRKYVSSGAGRGSLPSLPPTLGDLLIVEEHKPGGSVMGATEMGATECGDVFDRSEERRVGEE